MPHSTTLRKLIVSIPIIFLLLLIAHPAAAQNAAQQNAIIVTSSANSGPGTLREAITIANRQGGGMINFDPAVFPQNNPTTIWVESAFDTLTAGNITIDAKGAGVILDGSRIDEIRREDSTNGLLIQSNDNVILGLQILNFPGNGIFSQGGERNTFGGARPDGAQSCVYPCNLISGNGSSGIILDLGRQNVVQGNFIGTDLTGTQAFGNDLNAIRIVNSEGNLIGGYQEGEGNLIDASSIGLEINDSKANNNQVVGNKIGVDITGTIAIGNEHAGVSVFGGHSGGWIESNIIAGNERGITLSEDITNTTITNNFIGTNPQGSSDIGNLSDGIALYNVSANTIGPGNVIMHNRHQGIIVEGETTNGNIITQNTIAKNFRGSFFIGDKVSNLPETPYNLTISNKEVMGFAEAGTDIEIYTGRSPYEGRYIGTTSTGEDGVFLWKIPDDIELNMYVTAIAYAPDGTTSVFSKSKIVLNAIIPLAELPGTLDPTQVSTKPEVLATNAAFAVGFLVYLGVLVMLFDKTLEEYGDILSKKLQSRRRQRGKSSEEFGKNIWLNWLILLLIVASIQTLLDVELASLYDWASLALTIFISTLIVSGIQIVNEQFIRQQIKHPTDKELTNVRWAGIAIAAITMAFSRWIKFQPGFVLGAVDPFHFEPEIKDRRQKGVLIFATKLSVLVITLTGWLIAGRVADTSPGLRHILVMAFTLALEAFFVELLPISKILDGAALFKWNFFAWLGLYLPVTYFAFWLLFNPKGEGVAAVQQNSMSALIIVMIFILVALLLVTVWGRWLAKKQETA